MVRLIFWNEELKNGLKESDRWVVHLQKGSFWLPRRTNEIKQLLQLTIDNYILIERTSIWICVK